MEKIKNFKLNIKVCVFILLAVFIVSMIPVLMISQYNRPSSDDFGHSASAYHAWSETGSFFSTVIAQIKEVFVFREYWQGTYTGILIAGLHPGVFGHYELATYILFTFFITGTSLIAYTFFRKLLKASLWQTAYGIIIILLFSIEFVPSPLEAFYWYNGAVYYNVMYAIDLIFLALILNCIINKEPTSKFIWIGLPLFALMCGGGHLAMTMMLCCVTLVPVIYAFYTKQKKNKILFTIAYLCLLAGFIFNITAPGYAYRQAVNSKTNPILAVIRSFIYSFIYVNDWLYPSIFLSFVLLLPLFYVLVKKLTFDFKYPLIVTLSSWCLYATQYTPSLYATNTLIGRRFENQAFFSFYLFACVNIFYWVGWIYRKIKEQDSDGSVILKLEKAFTKYKTIAFVIICSLILCSWFFTRKTVTIAYMATQELLTGEAAAFAQEMDNRTEILENSTDQIIIVPEIEHKSKLLFSYEIGPHSTDWVNLFLQDYYEKESITIPKS